MGELELFNAFLSSKKSLNKFLELTRSYNESESIKKNIFNTFLKGSTLFNDDTGEKSIIDKGLKNAFKILKTQESSSIPSITEEIIKLSDAENLLFDSSGKLASLSDIGKNLLTGGLDFINNQVILYLNEQNGLLEEINGKTSLTGKLSKDYRRELIDTIPELSKIGIGLDEITTASIDLINQSGRFKLLSTETWIETGKLAKAYVGSLQNMHNLYMSFDRIGYGVNDVNRFIDAASKQSLIVGLETKNFTSLINDNISKVNQYGFKNGINGLSEMVKKSIEFKSNLSETYTVAEQLFDYDSIIQLSSNLQVLGGAVGDFADIHKLAYMATNDIGGLQDAIFETAKDLAVFNEKSGNFEVQGANLRIARDMAKALGMSVNELTNIAVTSNQRQLASLELANAKIIENGKLVNIDPKLEEFITNMAQMDGGEMKIMIPKNISEQFNREEINLKELAKQPELLKAFKEYQEEFKEIKKEDIIQNQASDIKNIERNVSFMVASLRVQGGREIGKLADAYGINILEDIKRLTNNFTKTDGNKMFGEEMLKNVKNILGVSNEEIKRIFKPLNLTDNTKAKENNETIKKEPVITKNEIVISVRNDSGAIVDAITREIQKDPEFARSIRDIVIKQNENQK